MTGKTCAGTWVTRDRHRRRPARGLPPPRRRHRGDVGEGRHPGGDLADRDQPGDRAGADRDRHWSGAGVLGPEAFDAVPFLDLMNDYGSPWGIDGDDPDPRLIHAVSGRGSPQACDAFRSTTALRPMRRQRRWQQTMSPASRQSRHARGPSRGPRRPRSRPARCWRPPRSAWSSRRADGRIVFANHRAAGADRLRAGRAGRPARRAASLSDGLSQAPPETSVRDAVPARRTATPIAVEVHLGPRSTAPTRLLVVTLRDMTELKEGREARFEAEAKYRALVDQIPAVVYLDPVDENSDSIYVSPQVTELIGVTPDRVAHRRVLLAPSRASGRHRPRLGRVRRTRTRTTPR